MPRLLFKDPTRRRWPALGWSLVATYVLLKLAGLFVPIRFSMQSQHG